MAFVSVSRKAWEATKTATCPRFYFDWAAYRDSYDRKDPENPFTPAISTMQGLREALRLYFTEGQDAVLARHRTLSEATKAGVLALGLELSGEYVERAWAVTAVKAPEGIDADEIVARVRADHRIVLAPGQGPFKGKVFRIGHLGNYDRSGHPARAGRDRDDARSRWATTPSRGRPWPPPRPCSPAIRGPERVTERPRVLVTEPLSESGLDLLRADFDVDVRPELAAEGLAEAIGPYDALIVRSQTKVTAEVLERADRLRGGGSRGHRAGQRGRRRRHAPGRHGRERPAVEHRLRRRAHGRAAARTGAQHPPGRRGAAAPGGGSGSGSRASSSTARRWASSGLGRVGAMVAQRAAAFGMRVVAYDPYVSKERGRQLGVELVPSLDALLVQADFLTIHLPRTPETEGLIGDAELALLPDGARVVNTSRGGIVDEDALARAIASGRLGGAAVDVFAEEPATASPLFARRPDRRDAAPRGVDQGGPGQGRRRRRRDGPPRPAGRVRARTPSTCPPGPRSSRSSAPSCRCRRSSEPC